MARASVSKTEGWGFETLHSCQKRKGIRMSKLPKAIQFVGEVRQELNKVTWPARRETIMTTAIVFIFAVVAALYFALVDNIIVRLLHLLIGG